MDAARYLVYVSCPFPPSCSPDLKSAPTVELAKLMVSKVLQAAQDAGPISASLERLRSAMMAKYKQAVVRGTRVGAGAAKRRGALARPDPVWRPLPPVRAQRDVLDRMAKDNPERYRQAITGCASVKITRSHCVLERTIINIECVQ